MALDNYTGKYTGAGQTIVVIGTGISNDYTNNNVVYSYDFADNDSDAINADDNHGGQVANVAQQVASGVKIIHLKVFSDKSSSAYDSGIEKALQWVVANTDSYGITAVNMSFGSGNVQTPTTWQGSDEYQVLDDKGVIVTVASGNNKESYAIDGVNILSSSDSVFSVSAVNTSGNFTTFSQNQEDLTDIAALGENVNVVDDKGGSHLISGTSFSAPIIAAAAAVIQEAATVLLGHKITDEEFMDLIQQTGDKITGYALQSHHTSNVPSSASGTSKTLELNTDDNSITKAQNIGALVTGAKVLKSSVTKTTDDKDFYKFELSANGKVDFLLSKLSADVDLNLYDSSGNLIYGGWDWGNVDIAYTKTLDAGVYFVEVDYYDGYNSGVTSTYNLSLTLGNAPTPDTDGSTTGAQNIGVLTTGTKVLQDSIAKVTDDKDFYKFELSANGKVDFLLSKLSADVDLNLYDSSGNLIHGGWDWGNVDIAYTKTLDKGVYFVEVDYYDGYNSGVTSTYDLSLTLGGVIIAPTPDTDDTIATAQNIGVLAMGTKVLQDSVTKTTDDKDFYKFELTAKGTVDFLLSKLSADVELNLYASDGSLIHKGWISSGNDTVTYARTLTTGVYFVAVDYKDYNNFNQDIVTTSYDLSLTLGEAPAPDTDGTVATAQNIGVLEVGTKVLQDSVTKTTDDKDFYKFELTANGKVDFLLSKLSADVVLNLYASDGSSIHEGSAPDNNDVAYTETLATGVYFVEVDYKDYADGFNQNIITTSYDLSLSLSNTPTPTPDTDGTIATAQNIGVLEVGTKVLQDSVTKTTDDKDFYKFELTAKGKVDFLLSKLSADVVLNLYASDGSSIHKGSALDSNDVTYAETLATGVYFVEVDYRDHADGFNQNITTTSYDLSLSLSDIPAPTPTPDTDGTIATAQNIGVLAMGTKVLQDSVTKTTDDKDFYKFELTAKGKVDFLLSKLSADVELNLYASDGSLIHKGWISTGNDDVAYARTLTTGVYFVAVDYKDYNNFNQDIVTTSYDLSLTLGEAPAPDTDGTIATAQNIGVLEEGTKVLQDSVTKTTDDKDFYKFELTTNGQVDFSLSKLSSDVVLNLYSSNGNSIYKGSTPDSNDVTYTETLATGVYFVEVDYRDYSDGFNQNIITTSYDLSFSLTKVLEPDADNTIATAQDIGVLATGSVKVLQDSVTEMTDDKDFYKFELTTNSKVDFLLSNLSANVDLNLYNEEGNTVRSSLVSDNSDVSYTQLLAAGTYYAEVDYADYGDNKEVNTTYDLSLKVDELKIPDAAGYTQINLANAVAYLETHQDMYNDQIIL